MIQSRVCFILLTMAFEIILYITLHKEISLNLGIRFEDSKLTPTSCHLTALGEFCYLEHQGNT